jgi:4'-phosphopantetheinyl transferase
VPAEEVFGAPSLSPGGDAAAWSVATEVPRLESGEVHVWRVDQEAVKGGLGLLGATLDSAERARAERFRRPPDRDAFLLFHGMSRVLLGRYLGEPAARIRLRAPPDGKPFLEDGNGQRPLEFNLSHSGGLALLAVTRGRPVGVDIERIRPEADDERIAQRFFSPEEVAALAAVPSERRSEAFFACWTRKEAYLKARGVGLSLPLRSFAVSVIPGRPPALLWSEAGAQEIARWSFRDLSPAPGYAGALAAEGTGWTLRLWQPAPELISRA